MSNAFLNSYFWISLTRIHFLKSWAFTDGPQTRGALFYFGQSTENRTQIFRATTCCLTIRLYSTLFLVGIAGFGPTTSPLSGERSNRLNYTPIFPFGTRGHLFLIKSRMMLCRRQFFVLSDKGNLNIFSLHYYYNIIFKKIN